MSHMSKGSAKNSKKKIWVVLLLVLSGVSVVQAAEDSVEDENLLPQAVPVNTQAPVVVGLDDYPDPLEPLNRIIFGVNDVLYRFALIPLGNAYTTLPAPAREGIARVFLNLREPINLVNHAAQGKPGQAGKNLFRFLTNSTLGLAGLFDPADTWFGVPPRSSRFNDTFRTWGIGNGPYLVMPFAGPTDLRGGTSSFLDSTLHPVRWITEDPDTTAIIVFDNFQQFAPRSDIYLKLRAASDDPYVYFRNQYLQAAARNSAYPARTQVPAGAAAAGTASDSTAPAAGTDR